MKMADEPVVDEQLECIDECEDGVEVSAEVEDEDEDTGVDGDDEKPETEDKGLDKSKKSARIFDNDRFTFTGQCETCSAGTLEDKDHLEFLVERSCAPSRSYFYRNALVKHWPDFQGLVISMQPFCHECKKHFWGIPDLTRHMYNMSIHGVEDLRLLRDESSQEVPKTETQLDDSIEKSAETNGNGSGGAGGKKGPAAMSNRMRAKRDRRRQVRGEAVHKELLRRLKRAEEVAASIPEEEVPNDEQREANKVSHTPLFNIVMDIIRKASTKSPQKDLIPLLEKLVCSDSPRWFEASYLLETYEGSNPFASSTVPHDLASGRANTAVMDARWRLACCDLSEESYNELTGKLNEQAQLSIADRERALRRIAETGDLWKDDECSPPCDAFTCLVCDRKGRSLRIHLDEALWLTHVAAPQPKTNDLPDCPISVEASLSEMRNNPVMAHIYHYLGEEHTRRLVEEVSFKSNRVLRCPACMFHYRALRCSLPALFSHLQTCGFMKIDGDFKEDHQKAALRISSLLAESRGGFRSTASIVDELIAYVSCSEGGLHLQRRGAPTMQSMKANPRLMAKIRQAVARKVDADEVKTPSKPLNKQTARKPANPRGAANDARPRDHLRGVTHSTSMKKKQTVVPRRSGPMSGGGPSGGSGFRAGTHGGSNILGAHVPANMTSVPVNRGGGGTGGGMLGLSRSNMGMANHMKVGVYCELCSQEFFGYSFMEANRFLHTHLMDALFRSRREPGQAKMAAQHLTCFNRNLVYTSRTVCPACRTMRDSLDSTLHHITQMASSTDMTAIQHMNVANEFVTNFIECMNGTLSLADLQLYVKRRFMG